MLFEEDTMPRFWPASWVQKLTISAKNSSEGRYHFKALNFRLMVTTTSCMQDNAVCSREVGHCDCVEGLKVLLVN